jgi:hypothetical protein
MKLHKTWIAQAGSDMVAARALHRVGADHCQVVAKCQQAMEKAVKGLVEAMNALGLVKMPVDSTHRVAKYASAMLLAVNAAPKAHRFLKVELPRLFPEHVQGCIAALDDVVPQYPKKGALAAKNTEYPFQLSVTDWRAPSAPDVFGRGDVRRYLAAAERVQGGASKVISALERGFPAAML